MSSSTIRHGHSQALQTAASRLLVMGFALSLFSTASRAEVLITPDEARRPPAKELVGATRGMTRGPAIEQVTPEGAAESPMPLRVRFIAHNNAAIDVGSVKATYLREPAVDLTERLKGHVTPQGIDFANAEVPPGTHVIRLELKDALGRTANAMIKLNVR
jgi:hypothetical protein